MKRYGKNKKVFTLSPESISKEETRGELTVIMDDYNNGEYKSKKCFTVPVGQMDKETSRERLAEIIEQYNAEIDVSIIERDDSVSKCLANWAKLYNDSKNK